MTVTLTPELERIVNAQLATGQFADAQQVVWTALMSMQMQYEELKRLIAEGIADADAGRVAPFDPRATLERVRAKRAARTSDGEEVVPHVVSPTES